MVQKQFKSWGEYVKVNTAEGTFDEVIICPIHSDIDNHLLEYSNGFTRKVKTSDIKSIERYNAMVN